MIVMNLTPELQDVGREKDWRRMRISAGRGTGLERTGKIIISGGTFERTADPGAVTGRGKGNEEVVLTTGAVVLTGEKTTVASEESSERAEKGEKVQLEGETGRSVSKEKNSKSPEEGKMYGMVAAVAAGARSTAAAGVAGPRLMAAGVAGVAGVAGAGSTRGAEEVGGEAMTGVAEAEEASVAAADGEALLNRGARTGSARAVTSTTSLATPTAIAVSGQKEVVPAVTLPCLR